MTAYGSVSPNVGYSEPAQASKPTILLGAIVLSVLSAAFGLVGAFVVLGQGNDYVTKLNDPELQDALRLVQGSPLYDAVVEEAYDTLKSRAIIGAVLAALVLLFTLFARRAATWARIVLTVVTLAYLALLVRNVTDVASSAVQGLQIAALVCAVVAPIMLWLPATNAYNKQRKSAR